MNNFRKNIRSKLIKVGDACNDCKLDISYKFSCFQCLMQDAFKKSRSENNISQIAKKLSETTHFTNRAAYTIIKILSKKNEHNLINEDFDVRNLRQRFMYFSNIHEFNKKMLTNVFEINDLKKDKSFSAYYKVHAIENYISSTDNYLSRIKKKNFGAFIIELNDEVFENIDARLKSAKKMGINYSIDQMQRAIFSDTCCDDASQNKISVKICGKNVHMFLKYILIKYSYCEETAEIIYKNQNIFVDCYEQLDY